MLLTITVYALVWEKALLATFDQRRLMETNNGLNFRHIVSEKTHRFCSPAIHRRTKAWFDSVEKFQAAEFAELGKLDIGIGNEIMQADYELSRAVNKKAQTALHFHQIVSIYCPEKRRQIF